MTMRMSAYTIYLPINPANVFEFVAAKTAVPAHNPSMNPPPFLLGIYLNARKESIWRLKSPHFLW